MSLFVKICGVADPVTAQTVCEAGADAIGFVFASSSRRLTPQQAASIAAALPEDIIKVAVFRRTNQREVDHVLGHFAADLIQADHSSRLSLPEEVGWLPVYRSRLGPVANTRLLFEGGRSGVGELADWDRAEDLARTRELVLAGGLTVDNVGTAIRKVRPFGVDVSSGVEDIPGHKDPGLIRQFVASARQTAQMISARPNP